MVATLVRPVWIIVWISIAYGELLLVPAMMPVRRTLLPPWVWLSVFLELGLLFGVVYAEHRRGGSRTHQWLAAALAGPPSAGAMAIGSFLLLTGAFEPFILGIMGVISLMFLVWWDREAVKGDVERRPLWDLLS